MTDQQLNEQVARKLGHRLLEYPDSGEWKIRQDDGPKMFYLVDIPDYYHSIQAAWEVVERLSKEFCFVEVSFDRIRLLWQCSYAQEGPNTGHFATADTAPKAICLAFVKFGLDKQPPRK